MRGDPTDRDNLTEKTGSKEQVTMSEADISLHASDNATLPSPGALLRTARERANYTIPNVAAQLRLGTRIIEALEEDRYQDLPPAPAFVRGYLRGYAHLLSLPSAAILEAYDRQKIEPPNLIPDITSTQSTRGEDIPTRILPYLIIGGVILLAVLWWQNQPTTSHILPADDQSSGDPQLATTEAKHGVWVDLQEFIDEFQSAVSDIVTPATEDSVSDAFAVNNPNLATDPATASEVASLTSNSDPTITSSNVSIPTQSGLSTTATDAAISMAALDATTSTAVPYATTSTTVPDAATSTAVPYATTSTAVPDATTSTTVPDATTSTTVPDAATSTAVPDATTSTAVPDATTSTAVPDATTSTAIPDATTSTAIPDATTSTAVPDATTAVAIISNDTSPPIPGSPPAAATVAADSITLSLVFSAESWVEIYSDAGKNRLAYRLAQPGSRLDLHGPAPIDVVFGAPDTVQFWLNQQLHSVTPYTVRGIARFYILSDGKILPGASFQPEPEPEPELELEPELTSP